MGSLGQRTRVRPLHRPSKVKNYEDYPLSSEHLDNTGSTWHRGPVHPVHQPHIEKSEKDLQQAGHTPDHIEKTWEKYQDFHDNNDQAGGEDYFNKNVPKSTRKLLDAGFN